MFSILNFIHHLRCYAKKKQSCNALKFQKNVVVSLTTTPSRIKKIWPTLNSILLQSTKPEKIYLWIPKKYKRFPLDTISQLPDFMNTCK